MTAKPVFYYLVAPDGTCFIYPTQMLPCELSKDVSVCIDQRLYEIDRIIANFSADAAEEWVLSMVKRLRGMSISKFLNMGPKTSLLLDTNRAVLVILKDVETATQARGFSMNPEARLAPEPEPPLPDFPLPNTGQTKS